MDPFTYGPEKTILGRVGREVIVDIQALIAEIESTCATCRGRPPRGFACLTCGETRPALASSESVSEPAR